MTEIVRFRVEHAFALRSQEKQEGELALFSYEHLKAAEDTDAITLLDETGHPVFCGGLVGCGFGRAQLWGYFSCDTQKYMVQIVRKVRAFLWSSNYRRIEAHARSDFPAAHRFLKLIGLECEAEMLHDYFEAGGHAALYAKVNRT